MKILNRLERALNKETASPGEDIECNCDHDYFQAILLEYSGEICKCKKGSSIQRAFLSTPLSFLLSFLTF